MTKTDLIAEVADRAGLTRAEADRAVRATMAAIAAALTSGDKVSVAGFGSFNTSERGPRTYKNPRTGELHEVGPGRVVRFKPSRGLVDEVNS